MTSKQFSEALGELPEKYISEAEGYKRKKRSLMKWVLPAAGVAAAAIALFVVLGGKGEPAFRYPTDGMEIVQAGGDRMIYTSLPELEAASDVIVIAEFAENATQTLTPENGINLIDAVSVNSIVVCDTLSGEIMAVSSHPTVSQRYGVLEEQNKLVTFSGLTPMNKGDKWIFFLSYDEQNNTYWVEGDTSGRYPLPEGDIAELYKETLAVIRQRDAFLNTAQKISADEMPPENAYLYLDANGGIYALNEDEINTVVSYEMQLQEIRDGASAEEFGVYDNQSINLPLYCAIIDKYGLYSE